MGRYSAAHPQYLLSPEYPLGTVHVQSLQGVFMHIQALMIYHQMFPHGGKLKWQQLSPVQYL